MPYRDESGHFITEEEARARGIADEEHEARLVDEEDEEAVFTEPTHFGQGQRDTIQPVFVDTGRGQTMEVQTGAPFIETLERLADELHYGGWYRIFLNGSEVVAPWVTDTEGNPALDENGRRIRHPDCPETIESGMRIAITSYDKVGLQ